MGRSDAVLLTLKRVEAFLREVDQAAEEPIELVLVGGAAVLLLCRDHERETRDLDTLTDAGLVEARRIAATHVPAIDINHRAAMFESYLPGDWVHRVRIVFQGRHRLRVFTPCPEDLAVMKVFRFAAKDEDDLPRLVKVPGFRTDQFLESFVSVLRVSIGDKRRDAQTFSLVWNHLFPDEVPLDADEVCRRAGLPPVAPT